MGPAAPNGQLRTHRDEGGWRVRQVLGRSRQGSHADQVIEEHLMRAFWQRCEQVDGNQEGLVQNPGAGERGEPLPPTGLKDQGKEWFPEPLCREGCLTELLASRRR